MECIMRTTLTLDGELLAEFKRIASETHRTLSAVVEDALRESLLRRRAANDTKGLRLPTYGSGGTLPGVDLDSNAALQEYLDEVDGENEAHRGQR